MTSADLPAEIRRVLNDLARIVHERMVEKGFWDERVPEPYDSAARISLMMTELGEAIQELRDENEYGVVVELADTLMRILDFCGSRGWRIGDIVASKFSQEGKRPYRHGRRF